MSAFPGFGPGAYSRFVEADGVRMRVVEEGDGPPIIWIPGGDAPAEAYSAQFPFFTDRYRCIAYDPRGAGETASPPPPWSIEELGRDCAALIEAVCDGPAIVAGLSMGALITQSVAIQRPDLVRLAIPMGSSACIDGFTRDWMEAEMQLRRDGIRLPPYFLAAHYAAYAFPAAALGNREFWETIKPIYTARFDEREPENLIGQWQACLDFDCREALGSCPVPMHVIGFEQDLQTPPEMCREVADLALNGVFHEIAGLAHVAVLGYHPDLVAAKIREIIETA